MRGNRSRNAAGLSLGGVAGIADHNSPKRPIVSKASRLGLGARTRTAIATAALHEKRTMHRAEFRPARLGPATNGRPIFNVRLRRERHGKVTPKPEA